MEGNGLQSMVGGGFYVGRSVTSVKILNSWLGAGLPVVNSSANYLFWNNGSSELIEKDNFKYCPPADPFDVDRRICTLYNGVSNTAAQHLTSVILGDPGAAGQTTVVDLLSVSDDALFMVAGTIHLTRTGQEKGFSGTYPFLAAREASGLSRHPHLSVGKSTIPSGTHFNLSFARRRQDGTKADASVLQLTIPGYEWGFVTLDEQASGQPTAYIFNGTVFPAASGMPRKTDDDDSST